MKHRLGILKSLLALAVAIFFLAELGILGRILDRRCIVEDSISGGSHRIIAVDGKKVDRIPHGVFVTRVPHALVPSGKHVIIFSDDDDISSPEKHTEIDVYLEKGKKYKVGMRQGVIDLLEIN